MTLEQQIEKVAPWIMLAIKELGIKDKKEEQKYVAENNLEYTPQVYPNMYPRIIKSMEQYGKEQYERCLNVTHKKYELILSDAGDIANENLRLRSLVQAQKELIKWMGIKLPSLSHENKCKMADFLNKIKELEQ